MIKFGSESSAFKLGWDPSWFGEKYFDDKLARAIKKYQNTNPVATTKQSFGQHDFATKLDGITNKNLLVKVKDSSGKTYRFKGTGKKILSDAQYQKLITRNLNRVYKAIKKKK